MATIEQLSELEYVEQRNQATESRFSSRRLRSIIVTGCAFVVCGVFYSLGNWALSVTALFIALIALSSYFTANGHLHHVRSRSSYRRRLTRDFSKLDLEVANENAQLAQGSEK